MSRPSDSDCIFCQIIAGELPSRTVYENDDVVAFLDVNPMAPGHTLVIPKGHYETLGETPADDAAPVFTAIHAITPAVEGAVDAEASTVAFNNGEAAGQEVPHLHGHIIPRFEGDGGAPFQTIFGSPSDLSDDEFDEIAAGIESQI